MEEIIWNVLMDLKDKLIDEDKAAKILLNILTTDKGVAITFAEWIGTNYEQDEGSVIGNVYFDRETRKDYNIKELWDIFISEEK